MSKKSEFSEWSKLIEKNIDWWFNTHDKEHYLEVNYYTVEEILDENWGQVKGIFWKSACGDAWEFELKFKFCEFKHFLPSS